MGDCTRNKYSIVTKLDRDQIIQRYTSAPYRIHEAVLVTLYNSYRTTLQLIRQVASWVSHARRDHSAFPCSPLNIALLRRQLRLREVPLTGEGLLSGFAALDMEIRGIIRRIDGKNIWR